MKIVVLMVATIMVAYLSLFLLPATRVGNASLKIYASAERILEILHDVGGQERWRKDIGKVELLSNGWIETTKRNEKIEFKWTFLNAESAELIFSSSAGYSGVWQAKMINHKNAVDMTVTETVTTPKPHGRLMSRLFFDPAAFSRTYLEELKTEAEK